MTIFHVCDARAEAAIRVHGFQDSIRRVDYERYSSFEYGVWCYDRPDRDEHHRSDEVHSVAVSIPEHEVESFRLCSLDRARYFIPAKVLNRFYGRPDGHLA